MSATGGLSGLAAAAAGGAGVPVPLSASAAQALDGLVSALAAVRGGRGADPRALAAGLEALGALGSGVPTAGVSHWRAQVEASPLGGRHVVLDAPGHELRLEVDRAGAAWSGAWFPGAGEPVVFELRRGALGWELATTDGTAEGRAALGKAPASLAWTSSPSLDPPPGRLAEFAGRGGAAMLGEVGALAAAGAAMAVGAAMVGVGIATAGREAVWHYAVGERSEGPVPEEDLRARLGRGEIEGDTPVWREGLPGWTTAREAGLVAPEAGLEPPAAPEAPDAPWHYATADGQQGPVPEAHLRAWLDRGDLPRDTLVWREGLPEWTSAEAAGLLRR